MTVNWHSEPDQNFMAKSFMVSISTCTLAQQLNTLLGWSQVSLTGVSYHHVANYEGRGDGPINMSIRSVLRQVGD